MIKIMKLLASGALFLGVVGCQDASHSPSTASATAPAATLKKYPLDVCIVSDEKLGGMGDPVVFVHEGREVKLCCNSCRKDFDKEPAKYMAKIAGK